MTLNPLDDEEGVDSKEQYPHSTENVGISSETKIDELIAIANKVQVALDNRRIAVFTTALAIGVASLISGAVFMWVIYSGTEGNQQIAERAYRQALQNNKDGLVARRIFAETRDCPVAYFRELVTTSRAGGDITKVDPPCPPIDVAAIDELIAKVDAVLAATPR